MPEKIVNPSILPGFMELLPNEQILFNKMLDKIKNSYEKYAFLPIDTPVIEKSEILLAKGGGETEKQIYKVVKGDTDMSLRFDLTVPLARYVAMHFHELSFPFRRYHIGKVYRGEKNQKGRFREFYQADIDIIGNGELSIINDAEIPSVIYTTFKDLGFDNFTIKINNRKLLQGFFEYLGINNFHEVLRIVDKLDKIGIDKVERELLDIGVGKEKFEQIKNFIMFDGNNASTLTFLKELEIDNIHFQTGLDELKTITHYIEVFGVPKDNFKIDLTIARGLDYYTGTVYETFLNDYPKIGSICSGGRYDNLSEFYTNQKLPGVGISIGLTRLFYQLKEAGIISADDEELIKALIIPMENFLEPSIEISNKLRNNGISCQIYLEDAKMSKKLNYANKIKVPFVIIIGEEEVKNDVYTLKNMKTGEQTTNSIEEIINTLLAFK
ncbi:histidine--tRNA ligase [Soehngenia longivitae]|uniref:Histidine--tRNA ligase n=1 Tax=Soehngenia longivitae TaxID=2562294 RepID=A0A4Z0D5W2_9FIRM|nr:histidine--tRNA ligase [Soehngenia longivitae]TFZ40267.1 histidine--tRNA ligase [Soehngenia longivitae]